MNSRLVVARLLSLLVVVALLLGSCAVPMVAFDQSARWSMQEVGAAVPVTFFVASRSRGGDASQIAVARYESSKAKTGDIRYDLPEGRHRLGGAGDGSATIEVTTEGKGSQLIRVYVVGDSPWASLSEYRVANDKVQPLRHGDASLTILFLGVPVCLALFLMLRKPINARIRRWLGVEPAKQKGQ